ncbi:hypothetical protein, partial [Mesorhizobium sp. M1C.F.Ca.ET.144.01.1.1]|uniref:hypothetical protein n=1 Tax=Mesorhizobium sp. M1C.F.Ca.ET.144.01.1.1 TaxID=2563921 RepID=UPI001AEF0173
ENAIGGTVLSRISPLTAPLKLNVRGIWRQQGFCSHFLRYANAFETWTPGWRVTRTIRSRINCSLADALSPLRLLVCRIRYTRVIGNLFVSLSQIAERNQNPRLPGG